MNRLAKAYTTVSTKGWSWLHVESESGLAAVSINGIIKPPLDLSIVGFHWLL